jgi:hypothetical protein
MNARILQAAVLGLLFLFALEAKAQIHHNIELIKRVTSTGWGTPLAISLEGNSAYILEENYGVRVCDISRPVDPRELTPYSYQGASWDLAISEEIGCIAVGRGGIIIVDFGDPEHPNELARLADVGNARGLAIDTERVFIASGEEGLVIVSISDQARPRVLGSCRLADFAISVVVSGNFAYVADRAGGLQVIDISNQNNPELVGHVDARGATREVAYQDGYIYLGETSVVSRVDVRDPTQPNRIAEINVGRQPLSVTVSGNYVYSSQLNLVIHDIQDNLAVVGSVSTASREVVIRENLAYVAAPGAGLRILDVSNPASVFEVSRLGTRIEFNGVTLSDGLVFFHTYPTGVMIYDRSDPTDLARLWQDSPLSNNISGYELIAQGNLLYTLESSGTGRLSVINIENPSHPILLGQSRGAGDFTRISLSGNYLIATSNTYSARIYDVRDPAHPNLATTVSSSNHGDVLDMRIAHNYAFLATEDGNLLVKDIADFQEIRDVALWSPASPIFGMVLRDNRLYLCCDRGFEVVDISRPADLDLLGVLEQDVAAYHVALEGDFAFLACERDGLRVIDISDPGDMKLTGFYITSSRAHRVAVSDSIAYVADGDSSFSIFNCVNAMRANQPPVWVQHPDSVQVFAGNLIRFDLIGTDVNDDTLSITMIRHSLPPAARIVPQGLGHVQFRWLTGAGSIGSHLPEFILSDGHNADTLEIPIRVLPTVEVSPSPVIPASSFFITAYPNPFNSSTTISYTLPKAGWTVVDVMDIQGRLVERLSGGWKAAGRYREVWGAEGVTSGEYFLRLYYNDQQTKEIRIILIK